MSIEPKSISTLTHNSPIQSTVRAERSADHLKTMKGPRADLFRLLVDKGVIDLFGQIQEPYAQQQLPPISSEEYQLLEAELSKEFSLDLGPSVTSVTISVQELIDQMQAVLHIDAHHLIGGWVPYLLLSQKSYVQKVFQQLELEALFFPARPLPPDIDISALLKWRLNPEKFKEDLIAFLVKKVVQPKISEMQHFYPQVMLNSELKQHAFQALNRIDGDDYPGFLVAFRRCPLDWVFSSATKARRYVFTVDSLSIPLERDELLPRATCGSSLGAFLHLMLGCIDTMNLNEIGPKECFRYISSIVRGGFPIYRGPEGATLAEYFTSRPIQLSFLNKWLRGHHQEDPIGRFLFLLNLHTLDRRIDVRPFFGPSPEGMLGVLQKKIAEEGVSIDQAKGVLQNIAFAIDNKIFEPPEGFSVEIVTESFKRPIYHLTLHGRTVQLEVGISKVDEALFSQFCEIPLSLIEKIAKTGNAEEYLLDFPSLAFIVGYAPQSAQKLCEFLFQPTRRSLETGYRVWLKYFDQIDDFSGLIELANAHPAGAQMVERMQEVLDSKGKKILSELRKKLEAKQEYQKTLTEALRIVKDPCPWLELLLKYPHLQESEDFTPLIAKAMLQPQLLDKICALLKKSPLFFQRFTPKQWRLFFSSLIEHRPCRIWSMFLTFERGQFLDYAVHEFGMIYTAVLLTVEGQRDPKIMRALVQNVERHKKRCSAIEAPTLRFQLHALLLRAALYVKERCTIAMQAEKLYKLCCKYEERAEETPSLNPHLFYLEYLYSFPSQTELTEKRRGLLQQFDLKNVSKHLSSLIYSVLLNAPDDLEWVAPLIEITDFEEDIVPKVIKILLLERDDPDCKLVRHVLQNYFQIPSSQDESHASEEEALVDFCHRLNRTKRVWSHSRWNIELILLRWMATLPFHRDDAVNKLFITLKIIAATLDYSPFYEEILEHTVFMSRIHPLHFKNICNFIMQRLEASYKEKILSFDHYFRLNCLAITAMIHEIEETNPYKHVVASVVLKWIYGLHHPKISKGQKREINKLRGELRKCFSVSEELTTLLKVDNKQAYTQAARLVIFWIEHHEWMGGDQGRMWTKRIIEGLSKHRSLDALTWLWKDFASKSEKYGTFAPNERHLLHLKIAVLASATLLETDQEEFFFNAVVDSLKWLESSWKEAGADELFQEIKRAILRLALLHPTKLQDTVTHFNAFITKDKTRFGFCCAVGQELVKALGQFKRNKLLMEEAASQINHTLLSIEH